MKRSSPVHAQLAALQPQWEERRGMRIATRVTDDDATKLNVVALADLSFLPRFGLKGPAAQQWLESQNIAPPAKANGWASLSRSGVIARLGRSEFFLEDGAATDTVGAIRTSLGTGAPGVYPVIRQDAGFALAGTRVNELLVQTCNVNFEEFGPEEQIAVMTQMIGVSVLVIRTNYKKIPGYRLWCDPTLAPYFWEMLSEIAGELGGGVIGADSLPG
ncbi:MAG: methylglutamate dehydrogenase [Betaproteobacteria bacterium]